MRSCLAILAIFSLVTLGCGAPAAPAQQASAPAASAETPVPASEPPSARVAAVAPSKESAAYVKAKIVFTNPSKRACRFVGYKLSWGAAHKDIKLETFSVPPGETRERWLRVNPDEGDLGGLTPEGSRVEVQVECGER